MSYLSKINILYRKGSTSTSYWLWLFTVCPATMIINNGWFYISMYIVLLLDFDNKYLCRKRMFITAVPVPNTSFIRVYTQKPTSPE